MFYLNWRIIMIVWWFYVIHQHELAIGIHVSPPSWIALLLPFPPYPSQLSQSTGFGCLASYIELSLSVLHMVMYMFQCYSLKSSHPFPLPLNSKVCSLHLCLLCCPAHRLIGKESVCNTGDPVLISGLGRSPAEWKGYPLQYSGLENSIDCIVHGVAKSWILGKCIDLGATIRNSKW